MEASSQHKKKCKMSWAKRENENFKFFKKLYSCHRARDLLIENWSHLPRSTSLLNVIHRTNSRAIKVKLCVMWTFSTWDCDSTTINFVKWITSTWIRCRCTCLQEKKQLDSWMGEIRNRARFCSASDAYKFLNYRPFRLLVVVFVKPREISLHRPKWIIYYFTIRLGEEEKSAIFA